MLQLIRGFKLKRYIWNTASHGFTLIEVLVTLLIISFMFIIMLSFFTQFKIIQQISQSTVGQNEVDNFTRYISKTLHAVRKVPLIKYGFQDPKFLVGTKNSVTFVAEARRGSNAYGVFDTTLKWDKSENKLIEIRKPRRFTQADTVEFVLMENISEFILAYGSFGSSNKLISWNQNWDHPHELPKAVRAQGVVQVNNKPYNFDIFLKLQN